MAEDTGEPRAPGTESESKTLTDLEREVSLARNPLGDFGADPFTFPSVHPYAQVVDDVGELRQVIQGRDQELAVVRSSIQEMIDEIPRLQREAQAAEDDGGQQAELKRARILGRIDVLKELGALLKRRGQ